MHTDIVNTEHSEQWLWWVHEIHQNLRNPASINRNPPTATKSTSTERKLIIEIQSPRWHWAGTATRSVVSYKDWLEDRCTYILNRTNQLCVGPIGLYPASMHSVTFLAIISGHHRECGPCAFAFLASLAAHQWQPPTCRRRRASRATEVEHHQGTVGRLSAIELIEVASILNFSILVECSPLIVRECVDFVSAYWISW